MSEVSSFRLYLLRGMYLLIAVGLGVDVWPGLLMPAEDLPHLVSVIRSVLGGISLMALLGIRYPLKMLPLLLFELTWKLIWVLVFGLPLWLNQQLDAGTSETLFACMFGIVLIPIVLPWGYVVRHYLKVPGDRWGRGAAASQDS